MILQILGSYHLGEEEALEYRSRFAKVWSTFLHLFEARGGFGMDLDRGCESRHLIQTYLLGIKHSP